MISDEVLLKIAVVVFLVGFSMLFFLTQQESGNVLSINQINENMIGEKVAVYGIAEDLQLGDNLMMVLIGENNTKTKVVMFDTQGINFKEGDTVVVRGEVSIYKGELEIVATKISRIESH
jgi:DNA/RNA endonuclease YhcR with UshA esterase domain